MTLIGLQGYFSYFSLKISVAHLSGPDDLAKDDVLPMTLSDIWRSFQVQEMVVQRLLKSKKFIKNLHLQKDWH